MAWGRNDNSTEGTRSLGSGHTLDGYLLELAVNINNTHTFFARAERVDKDNLFQEGDPLAGRPFTVNKISFGYLYDFPAVGHLKFGIGALGSVAIVPDTLDLVYGDDPLSFMVFARLKFN